MVSTGKVVIGQTNGGKNIQATKMDNSNLWKVDFSGGSIPQKLAGGWSSLIDLKKAVKVYQEREEKAKQVEAERNKALAKAKALKTKAKNEALKAKKESTLKAKEEK